MKELFLNNVMREIVSLGVEGITLSRENMSDVTIHAELDGDMSLMGDREGPSPMNWITASETSTSSSPDIQGLLGTAQKLSSLIAGLILKLLVSGFMYVMHPSRPLRLNPSLPVNADSLNLSMFSRRITFPAKFLFQAVQFPLQVRNMDPLTLRTIPNRSSSRRNCAGAGKRKGLADTGMSLFCMELTDVSRNKCQFAHSPAELRPVPRHPKYKTQLCKTFLEVPHLHKSLLPLLTVLTNRSVPATTVPVAVLCILRLASNVIAPMHPLFRLLGKCFPDLFVFLCVCLYWLMLCILLFLDVLGVFLYFLPFGVACCMTGIA